MGNVSLVRESGVSVIRGRISQVLVVIKSNGICMKGKRLSQ